jgi:malate permease and related proteins
MQDEHAQTVPEASFPPVSVEALLLVAAFAAGLGLQRYHRHAELQRWLWEAFFWTIAPAAAIYAYTTVEIDRTLVSSLVIVAVSSWLVLGLAVLVMRYVTRDDRERGALVLAGGWGNTVALGYPLANFAYGADGLALQVLYAQFYYGVPGIAISTSVARAYGVERPGRRTGLRATLRTALNPPLVAAVGAIALRVAGVDIADLARSLGHAAGAASGPVGLLQLGLALPLERVSHGARDLRLASVALALRHGAAPLMVYGLGVAAGVDVPAVFILAAAAPVAFHIVTLSRVFGLRSDLVRLLVVVSTVVGGALLVAGIALTR